MADRGVKPVSELDQGFEIDQYVKSLGESSSRVRLVMLAIIVASVAAFATLLTERDHAWELSRLAGFGQDYELIKNQGPWACPSRFREICRNYGFSALLVAGGSRPVADYVGCSSSYPLHTDEYKKVCEAVDRFNKRGIVSDDGAKEFAEKLWEAYINNVTYVRSPVLGFVFDINDLGLLTGTTFFILMMVMFYYSNRAHESLALSMWKVRGIVKKENCYDDPASKANLLYHALAMQQVFTVPPTLARWNDSWIFRKAHYMLFLVPPFVQGLVLLNDWKSRANGLALSPLQTWLSLGFQLGFMIGVLALSLLCIAHLNADDTLWEDVFLYINPRHKFKDKPLWRHWIKITDNRPPAWGLAVRKKKVGMADWREVLFLDSIHGSLLAVDLRREHYHNVFPVSGLKERRHTWARGLFLMPEIGGEGLYSKARPIRRFRDVSGRRKLLAIGEFEPVEDTGKEILSGLLRGSWDLLLSKRTLTKFDSARHEPIWSVGGLPVQTDGAGRRSGCVAIHALLPDGDSLFVTDGGWVRRIDPMGNISTWGGQPLGGYLRADRSFLLGMALFENEALIEAQERCRTEDGISARLLVCDFTLRRVFGVGEDKAWELYRSEWGWAPSGIAVDGDTIYLLEYRSDTAIGERINYLLRTRWHSWWVRGLFFFWRYLRVLRFDDRSFNDPKVVIELSSFDWSRRRRSEGELS